MNIRKGDKQIHIPGVLVFVGLIVVADAISNSCKLIYNEQLIRLEKLKTQ